MPIFTSKGNKSVRFLIISVVWLPLVERGTWCIVLSLFGAEPSSLDFFRDQSHALNFPTRPFAPHALA